MGKPVTLYSCTVLEDPYHRNSGEIKVKFSKVPTGFNPRMITMPVHIDRSLLLGCAVGSYNGDLVGKVVKYNPEKLRGALRAQYASRVASTINRAGGEDDLTDLFIDDGKGADSQDSPEDMQDGGYGLEQKT